MATLAVAVGVGGIVLGGTRAEVLAPPTTGEVQAARAAPAASELRFLRREAPARTTAVDAAGTVLATFTDGARTATLDGPVRTFHEPQFDATPVTTPVWVRLLPETWYAGAENAPWFRPWLEENLGSTEPDIFGVAAEYLDGAPEGRNPDGVRVRGDATFGPTAPPGAPPIENSDFVDYLGISFEFADGEARRPDPVHYGSLDCSGFVRMVFGYRSGYPLLAGNEAGPGLPRRAMAMAAVGPGTVVLPDTGAPPANLGALQPGDLLFFDLDRAPDGRSDHTAIYLGRDTSGQHRFVSSRGRANGPTLGDLGGASLLDGDGYYARSFRSAKRL
jgi:cell wall-associated NlpC family hydrolase